MIIKASQLGGRSIKNPADVNTIWTWGQLAGDYVPGTVVYQSASGTWTAQSQTAGQLAKTGIVLFDPRIDSSDFSRKDIDDAYSSGDNAPIGLSGTFICKVGALATNLVAGAYFGLSSTAGQLDPISNATDFPRGELAEDASASDTFVWMKIGAAMN